MIIIEYNNNNSNISIILYENGDMITGFNSKERTGVRHVASGSLVFIDRGYRGAYCLHHQHVSQ
jgi:hypothetical protein